MTDWDQQARTLDAHARSLPVRLKRLERALTGAQGDRCVNTLVDCADLRAALDELRRLHAQEARLSGRET